MKWRVESKAKRVPGGLHQTVDEFRIACEGIEEERDLSNYADFRHEFPQLARTPVDEQVKQALMYGRDMKLVPWAPWDRTKNSRNGWSYLPTDGDARE